MLERDLWAIILAGGEGVRLRPLTRALTGDERPKQFCPLFAGETLLDVTRRRARLVIPVERTLIVLTRTHERYYRGLLSEVPATALVVQPAGRGTAPAIEYGLLRVMARDPMATVLVLPSDHYVSDDARFMRHVQDAAAAVRQRPDLVVLLGVTAGRPETEYGWIEPGAPVPNWPLRRVSRFWEKPTLPTARWLLEQGCLWNTMVVVAAAPALVALMRNAVPEMSDAFTAIRSALGTPSERSTAATAYAGMAAADFSSRVLAQRPANLAVMELDDVDWTDLGRPELVLATLDRLRVAGPPRARFPQPA